VHKHGKEDDEPKLLVVREAAGAEGDPVREAVDHEAQRRAHPVRGRVRRALLLLLGQHGGHAGAPFGRVEVAVVVVGVLLVLVVVVRVRGVRAHVLDE
jgi:hypothetical protein